LADTHSGSVFSGKVILAKLGLLDNRSNPSALSGGRKNEAINLTPIMGADQQPNRNSSEPKPPNTTEIKWAPM